MTWGEARRLLQRLMTDPASHVAAAVSGWTEPTTREALVAMDQFDFAVLCRWVDGGKKGEKPKPYPRPWPKQVKKRAKPDASLTQAQIIDALRAAGHTAPLPSRAEVTERG
jgi:hypothetical protein